MKEHRSVHYDAVKASTLAMGQPVGEDITALEHADLLKMRMKLISERVEEVSQELPVYRIGGGRMDKAAFTRKLADLLYATYGMAVTFGLPIDEVFDRVHASNMSKLGDDGKPNLEDLF